MFTDEQMLEKLLKTATPCHFFGFLGMVQKRAFPGNIWPLRADPDPSRVGAGLWLS
jgi:hypothetical protein